MWRYRLLNDRKSIGHHIYSEPTGLSWISSGSSNWEFWTSRITCHWSLSSSAFSSATRSPPCVTSGVISNNNKLSEDSREASLFTYYDILLVFLLSICWESVGFTIEAQIWLPYSKWSSCPLVLKFCILSRLSWNLLTHLSSIFDPTRLFDMVIGRTIKYPKGVIVLSNLSWPNFQRSFTSYRRWKNLLMRWQAYANVLA